MSGSRVSRLQTLSTLHRQQQAAAAAGNTDHPTASAVVAAPLPPASESTVLAGGAPRRATIHRRAAPSRPLVAKRLPQPDAEPTVAASAAPKADGDGAAAAEPSAPAPESARSSSGLSPPVSARDSKYGAHILQSDTLLGTGAFGAVYLGVHDETGEMVAIKKVRLGADSDDARKQVELLVAEIRLMKQLVHPNVVRYLHAERQGESLCIYMEYMAGGSLNGMLKKFGKLSPSVVRVYIRHALMGIEYLHRRNIVHRDIKPDNILLASTGEAKLSDFGTSREFSDSANLLTVTGTPWFMAPEVVKGSGHGTSADIWSVGCTMLHLLTGQAPLEEFANPVTAMYQIATHPEKVLACIPDSIPAECEEAVRACLAEDPMQRATASQLLELPYFSAGQRSDNPHAVPQRPSTAPASRGPRSSSPPAEAVPEARTVTFSRPGGPLSNSGGAVPVVPVLPIGRNAPAEAADGAQQRPGTPPTIGTPRSFATKLRDQTQQEQ